MTVCCCASPDCMANGCSIQRGLQQPAQMWPPTACNPPPMGYATGVPMPVITLTAEDVRRIVREELDRDRAKDRQPRRGAGEDGTAKQQEPGRAEPEAPQC